MLKDNAQQAYIQYKALTKARDRSKNFFRKTTFKNRILKLRRSKPNPKTGGYFVSNNGLATNSGIRFDEPIDVETFRKIKLQDWDKVYFERGYVYNWLEYEVTTNNNTFSSYGTGADPIFLGSQNLGAATWSSESGGFYKTALGTAPLWITRNGEMARRGESDWIQSTAVATATTITGPTATLNAFNSVQSLVDVRIRLKEFNFRYSYQHIVTAYDTGTGVLTIGAGGVVGGQSGLPFKLYGQKQFATQEGDWYYDNAAQELWIKTVSDPTGTDIRVITEEYAFNVQASNVTIENIEFTQYFESAIEAPDTPALTITGVSIHDNRQNGLLLYGNNTTFTASNFTIERCGLQGIHLGAVSASTISNFTINEIGQQANLGWPVDTYWIKTGGCGIAMFWDSGETRTTALNVDISNGDISNVGYMGILCVGDNHDVSDVVCHDFCTEWNDGGAFYTIHRASLGASTKNVTFTDCTAYNGIGSIEGIGGDALTPAHAEGFYVDNGSELVTFTSCIAYNNSDRGFVSNWDTQLTSIINCVAANNGGTAVLFRQDTDVLDSPVFANNDGNVMTGCLLVSNGLEYCVEKISFNSDPNYNPFSNGGSSNNNTYVRPYGSTICASRSTATGNRVTYNLAGWQTHLSTDASSTETVSQITLYKNPQRAAEEVPFNINLTASPITVDGTGYEDISGTPLGAGINLDPGEYLSMIIITQPTPDLLLDTFTGANGTTLAGRAPNVGPIPTIAAGTHTIQTNRWATSVNGRVVWNIAASDVMFTISQSTSNVTTGLNTYFRRVDDNNRFVIAITATTLTLFEFNSSASATNTWIRNVDFVNNNVYVFSIVAIGTSIKIYINSVLYIDVTSSYTTAGEVGALGNTTRVSDYLLAETP